MKKIEKPLTYILSILVLAILIKGNLSKEKKVIDNQDIKIEAYKINVDSIINAVLQETDNQE